MFQSTVGAIRRPTPQPTGTRRAECPPLERSTLEMLRTSITTPAVLCRKNAVFPPTFSAGVHIHGRRGTSTSQRSSDESRLPAEPAAWYSVERREQCDGSRWPTGEALLPTCSARQRRGPSSGRRSASRFCCRSGRSRPGCCVCLSGLCGRDCPTCRSGVPSGRECCSRRSGVRRGCCM